MDPCRIEIILGCMYSGKSTELIRRCGRYQAIDKNVLLINHSLDTRTTNKVQTHNKMTMDAYKTNKLMSNLSIYEDVDIIGIDEAQFFEDLFEFIQYIDQKQDKIVILAGLDGDSNREPFGHLLRCIPYCDEVTKLSAMDMVDKDGSLGIFTKRIVHNSDKILVGAQDCFIAVSRKNYSKELKKSSTE